ncbi:IST1-like protein [Vitis vinifera]|uniref:IST1-like protein n=1 Tax=Vitis vinifera TaxID=29760 RepID=A0A438J8Z1_VITVI|nr:IST1-like protein [Vitis vinifera]
MLHRSFKPAKCKTSLKLAVSRIKLLKNRREAQLKQMKRDLAQLLQSGQDQTARIRVEHVVREEKTMAAYDLIEVYCEMIAARLPIIESQKNCPIDLKEAITSIIFASPRCSDIPELMEIRKHFTAKYGKDFISVALELRPECGVSRNLVEKLSATAPDGQTKIKILAAIAEEHNIKWEPKSFEENESKPPEVLLSGADTFEKASKMQMEPPDVQAPLSHGQKPDVPVNLYEHNVRSSQSSHNMSSYNSQNMSSLSSQNISSTDFGANKATMSGSSPPEPRPSGTVYEEMGFRHSYSENVNPLSPGRQNWNMEFKDATAAAQAAAESAERASMAARAAAELSSRGRVNTQYSTESQKSSAFDSRDEGPGKFAGSKFQGEHLSKVSANNSFHDRNPRSQNVQMDGNQQDNLEGVSERLYRDGNHRKSSQYSSLKSDPSSIDEVNTGQRSDSYSQRSSSAVEATKLEKGNFFEQSDKSEVGFLSEHQGGMKNENVDYSGNARIKRESSTLSPRSHSSAFGDAYDEISNLSILRSDNDAGENPFAARVVFDEYGSDDNDHKFDVGSKDSEEELNTDFQSLVENRLLIFQQIQVLGVLGKAGVAPSQPENLLPGTFDDSDGLSSESEKELDEPMFSGRTDPSIIHLNENVHTRDPEPTQSETQELEGSSFGEKGNSRSNRKPWVDSSSDDSDTTVPKRNQRREFKAESQKKFGFSDVSSPGRLKSVVDQNDLDREPFYNPADEEKHPQSQRSSRLSFVHEVKDKDDFDTKNLPSIMKSGFRNKGYKRPPYVTQPSSNASSLSKPTADDTPPTVQQSVASSTPQHSIASTATQQSTGSSSVKSLASHAVHSQEAYNQEARTKVNKKSTSRSRPTYFDSDTDDSEEELPELPQHSSKKESYNQKAGVKDNTKLSPIGPITYFGMDDDSEEDIPKPTLTSTGRPTSSFSRRTKASSNFETSSYSKSAATYESATASNNSAERKTSSRRSHSTETMPNAWSQTMSSGQQERKLSSQRLHATESAPESQYQTKSPSQQESSEWHRSSEQATHKPMPEPKTSLEKESSKYPAIEQQSNPVPKTVASGGSESSKPSSSSTEPHLGKIPSRKRVMFTQSSLIMKA